MEVTLDIAGDQINGARDYQEDAFLTTYLTEEGGDAKSAALVVVADGMGGHAAGNIASNLVVSTFNKTFTGKYGKQDPPSVLREALKNANEGLKESIKETPALDGMGCTMVTAAFSKGKVFWISVGDSHLYLIRDRTITKKNEDHSYGGYLDRMREQGIDVEAEAGLSRNMLMSAMTGEEIAEIDCPKLGFQLLPGDRVIIASDGLDTLDEEAILKTSAWSHTPTECVSGLLRAVDDAKRPRQDNTTVVVVDVKERKSSEAPPPDPAKTRATQAPIVESRPELARERDVPVAAASGGRMGTVMVVLVVLALAGGGVYAYVSGMLDGLLAGPDQEQVASNAASTGAASTQTPTPPPAPRASDPPVPPPPPAAATPPEPPKQPEPAAAG
ncbi:MAG: SpoIIE family protein phosphatase, partial [Gammaproteobacteria bacterium]|nr:SpoIIE family protein phosphatase [Gammaproteobacteria bacterium]